MIKYAILALIVLFAAVGCAKVNPLANVPTITATPDTNGTSTAVVGPATPTPANAGGVQTLAIKIGNLIGPDDANAINISSAGKDPIGNACYVDIANLANAMKPAPLSGNAQLGDIHLLTDLETIRLGLLTTSSTGLFKLKMTTFTDCSILVQDTRAKGIEVVGQLTDMLNSLAVNIINPVP